MPSLLRNVLIALAVLIVLGLLMVGDRSQRDVPRPDDLPPAVVTLGDSTLSGEGAGEYEPNTDGRGNNWCHRSALAPIHQMSLPPNVARINLACSGAESTLVGSSAGATKHPEGSQAQKLADIARHYRIEAVIVQTGANDDPDFVDVVHQCVAAWAGRAPSCSEQLRGDWPRRVDRMQPKVTAALQDVRRVLDEAGQTPRAYSLIVSSYASPVGPGISPQMQDLSGCPFRTEDLIWLREVAVRELSQGLREVAEQQGARFLDLANAARGHEACTGGSRGAPAGQTQAHAAGMSGEWFTGLTVDWESLRSEYRAPYAMQESFHANREGHAQIGRCLGAFLTSPARTARCVPDGDGGLRLLPE